MSKFVDVSLKIIHVRGKTDEMKIRTYQGRIVVDKEKKIVAGRLDGFWLLVTNHT